MLYQKPAASAALSHNVPVDGPQFHRRVLTRAGISLDIETQITDSAGNEPRMASETDSKSLKNLLSDAESSLGALAGRAACMVALRDRLASSLPDDMGSHITDAAVDADNVLVVVCESAAWAARLRFHADDLLCEARRGGFPAGRCRVRARPVRQ